MDFVKYTGAGNDFVLIDNRESSFPLTNHRLISRLCSRHFGIGADGLLLLEGSDPWTMRLLQPDGQPASMCGNGIRCFKAYLDSLNLTGPTAAIKVAGRFLTCTTLESGLITVEMGDPLGIQYDLTVDSLQLDWLDTGVPHLVVPVADIQAAPMTSLAPTLRHHTAGGPNGANVNFVQMLGPREIAVRTYERGVEGETLACGTGVTAAALATAHHMKIDCGPITAHVASGSTLIIHFQMRSGFPLNVTMTGPAERLFAGCWD